MHFLYRIINTENQKVYIGQTNNPSLRWSQHKSNAKYNRGNQVITRAIAKYGAHTFQFEVIATCHAQEDINVIEEQVIRQSDSRNKNKGYNVDRGGNISPRTPEVLAKISISLRKHYQTHNGWLKGKKLTEEWKWKISKASIGKQGNNTGKTFDNDWKNKISKSQAGKPRVSKRRFSEETEKEIGRLYVEETKSAYAIGKEFDCQRTVIADILKRRGIETRQSNYTGHSNTFSLEQEKEICETYQEGKASMSGLAKKFNCGRTTVRDILLRHDIKL